MNKSVTEREREHGAAAARGRQRGGEGRWCPPLPGQRHIEHNNALTVGHLAGPGMGE